VLTAVIMVGSILRDHKIKLNELNCDKMRRRGETETWLAYLVVFSRMERLH
jgi:hypothetical protein